MMIQAISYGGGVQSTALLVLAARGEIPHRLFLFANVGADSENPATLAYLEQHARPYAAAHGIELVELQKHDRAGQPVTLYGRLMTSERSIDIPMRMANGAPGNRNCTETFKINVIKAELKRRGATKDQPAELALGISLDEYQRMRTNSGVPFYTLAYPLIERRLDRAACMALIERAGLPVPPKSSCTFCVAGETEILTRDGIKQIKDVAGQDVDLFVPAVGAKGGLSVQCGVKSAPVRSFGVQPLWKITLGRGRATREIFATAEHRWFLESGPQYQPAESYERTTATLKPGDRLKRAHAVRMVKEQLYPFPIAQGFVFGDGGSGTGDRPATLDFHGAKKAMLRFFAGYEPCEQPTQDGKTILHIHGLPRTWKDVPSIRESRSFLYSWLAGYFAADGYVSAGGQVSFDSSRRDHLEFVRSALAIIGVDTSNIRSKLRLGTGTEPTPIYTLNFSPHDVDDAFFLLDHHRDRIQETVRQRPKRTAPWTVRSIEPTDRVEEVFCATVDGVGAFALPDGLMTGNCPFQRRSQWKRLMQEQPDRFQQAVELERAMNDRREALGKDHVYLTSAGKPLDEAVQEDGQLSMFEGGSCDIGGYCAA